MLDIYNVENMAGQQSSFFTKILPILTTILGFCLGFIPSWIDRRRKRKSVGDTFDNQKPFLARNFTNQISSIDTQIEAFKNKQLIGIGILNESIFDTINGLDKELIKFHLSKTRFKRKKQKKAIVNDLISAFFYTISICILDLRSLDLLNKKMSGDITKFMDLYMKSLGDLRLEMDKYATSKMVNDSVFIHFAKLFEKYIKDQKFSLPYVLSIRESFHDQIFKDPNFSPENPISIYLRTYNFRIREAYEILEADMNLYVDKIGEISARFKANYKSLFGTDYKKPDVTPQLAKK